MHVSRKSSLIAQEKTKKQVNKKLKSTLQETGVAHFDWNPMNYVSYHMYN